jgi:peptidoglycan/xylan/chitin deacetylase (PgdA/CDA1 family)
MGTENKIVRRITSLYRRYVVMEDYPMLTSFSRNGLKKEGAIGIVYMLHHICDKNPKLIPTNEDLKVSPSFLEKIILKYKNRGFDFLSLDNLYKLVIGQDRPKKPFVVFTIDDGYLDNFTNALPIFEKYSVPFCIFVATDFIDKKAILWWDTVEDLILSRDSIAIDDGTVYPCTTFQQRWDTFRYLRERILKLDQSHLEEGLNRMFANYTIDWYKPIMQKGMSWE